VRLIGQLGDQRQVITTEAIATVIIISLVYVGPGEGNAIEFLLAFILPHGGFNAAKAEGLYRLVRGGSGVLLLSRRVERILMAYSSFFLCGAGLLSRPKGGGATRDEGTLWGDSFQGGPECSLSAKAADQGRRCRQREQERLRREKERSARSGIA